MFLDTETEVAGGREIVSSQLVFSDLQATLQDLFGLGAANGAMDSDLLVTTNTKRTHRVAGLRIDGLLASQLFQHLQEN